MRRGLSARGAAFVAILFACIGAGAGYAVWAVLRGDEAATGAERAEAAAAVAKLPAGPRLVFQHYSRRTQRLGNVGVVALNAGGRRVISQIVCERVYFVRARGVCLKSESSALGPRYRVKLFGDDFEPRTSLTLSGIPSRVRISPDGRYGATTAFVFGHSYKDAAFSTQTLLLEMATGAALADLETFALVDSPQVRRAPDFNYWGVTFARDSNRFYATLRTRDETYLVQGDVRARTVRILRENVECPSLSPDNTRVAFKKVVGPNHRWRLHVLDLRTMKETPLAETRPVDDQVEWLDDEHILYGLEESVWKVRADGTGSPEKLLSEALSPAVVRA